MSRTGNKPLDEILELTAKALKSDHGKRLPAICNTVRRMTWPFALAFVVGLVFALNRILH